MDLYTLNSTFGRDELIENYESLIWTERFSELGDFDLRIKSTSRNRLLLTVGTYLVTNRSDRVMKIESVEEAENSERVKTLTIKGRSAESLMEDRSAVYSIGPYDTSKYYINNTPGYICRRLFYEQCVTGIVDAKDVIPYLAAPNYTPHPLETSAVVNWLVEPDSLFNAVKKLCDLYDLGFKLVLPPNSSLLDFVIYGGANRTSSQSVFDVLTFATDLDNIQNTKSLKSNQNIKNVAYLASSALNRVIYADGVDPNVSGFQRRIVTINLGDKGEPPNDGPMPVLPPEPVYGVADQDPEPNYGQPVYIPEPNYGVADQDPEPFYGVADQDPEPYYPPYVPPREPDYGTPPTTEPARTEWEEEHFEKYIAHQNALSQSVIDYDVNTNAMRNNWLASNHAKYIAWFDASNNARNNWIASNFAKLTAWEEAKALARAEWIAFNEAERVAWETERARLNSEWLASNATKYAAWEAAMFAARQAWLDAHSQAVEAWEAENARLYQVWIAEISADMTQKAAEELGKYKYINSFDGEIDERTGLRYGVDYNLGDLVELRNQDGLPFVRRVTEQIFVSDTEGERAYPTLSEKESDV